MHRIGDIDRDSFAIIQTIKQDMILVICDRAVDGINGKQT